MQRHVAPVWLMGMANMTFGLYGGFVVVPLPQLLAAQHVPEWRIAAITGSVLLPGFWAFSLGPMLDVRFSRRWYAAVFAALAGTCLAAGVACRAHLGVMEILLVVGYACATLSSNALFGWMSTIIQEKDESRLSSWSQVAAFLGYGSMAVIAGELVRALPLQVAAVLIGAVVVIPATVFIWMPAPGPDRRLASESFRQFFGEIVAILKRREVLVALALFLLPCTSFALTNTLSGLGTDFHASERMVGVLGGAGNCFAGIAGSLLLMPLARWFKLRPLYLGIGVVGAVFTASLLLMPHTAATFGVAMLGENLFQALGFTGAVAICLETIGRNNPLAATQFSLLSGATALPIVYMGVIDGRAYSWHGVTGEYVADAGISLVVCLGIGLGLGLWGLGKRSSGAEIVDRSHIA